MKRTLLLGLSIFLTVSTLAQQRTVRVRLFWQHPPKKITVVPERATLRPCPTCTPKLLTRAIEVTGNGSTTAAGLISSSTLVFQGQARIKGDTFASFTARGEWRIRSRDGLLLLTLTMPLEEYVSAVLQGEGTVLKSDEALKAMAVAARTYALHFGSRHRAGGFDFCDTTHCQDLRLGNESARVRAAVTATEGAVLWFEGRPAATYYHRSCGGEIEDAHALEPGLRAAYLRSHHDDYCLRIPDEWQAVISKADLGRALNRPVSSVAVAERFDSGRAKILLLDRRTVNASDFRLAVGRALGWDKLRSDFYQVENLGGSIVFRGRGQGHGVGLCQAGAENMGEQGHTYREILSFYYPGAKPGLNAQGLAWEKLSGESVDLVTTNPDDASILLPAAERALRFAVRQTGWTFPARPVIKVYPTIAVYRDATGEPGWVAASTRGEIIRLQPITTLQSTHVLDQTLRHEFLHLLIEAQAQRDAPLWLREGLVIYLSNPDLVKPAQINAALLEKRMHSSGNESEMRLAYRESASAVAEAIRKNGLQTVVSWLTKKSETD
jgi:stage II sporulation protein D